MVASVEREVWQARFMAPMLAAGGDRQRAMERAAQRAADLDPAPVLDRALLGAYRRQQELAWVEQLVEDIEAALEDTGMLGRPGRVPAMCFLDLVGYTRLTEERGDAAAAALAETLAVLVGRSAREHGGVPVKWLGDGVMVWFREPAWAVLAALGMVEQLPEAGLPPAHVGVAAGPVVVQGGDYFGRTVNLAARIAARAGAGEVLVSEPRGRVGPARGRDLRGVGGAAAGGVRPSGAAAGGPPGGQGGSARLRPASAVLGHPAADGRLGLLLAGLVDAVLGAQLLGPALVGLGVVPGQLVGEHGVLGQDVDPGDVVGVGDVEEAAVHRDRGAAAAGVDEHRADGQGGQQRRVAGEHAEVAVHRAGGDEVGLAGPHLALGGDQVDLQAGHG